MTIQEMYQEMQDQQVEDLQNGYTDQDFFDDCYNLPEVDYTTQESATQPLSCASWASVHQTPQTTLGGAILVL